MRGSCATPRRASLRGRGVAQATEPARRCRATPNKEMKLTSPERIGGSQLISGVLRTLLSASAGLAGGMMRGLLGLGLTMLLTVAERSAAGQAVPSASIRSVESVDSVRVTVGIAAATGSTIVVPTCGADEKPPDELCGLAARLEVRSEGGWRAVGFRPGVGAVLGGLPMERWKVRVVPDGATTTFTFWFATHAGLDLRRGDRLRIAVDTWPDERSMRAGASPTQVRTPEFRCP